MTTSDGRMSGKIVRIAEVFCPLQPAHSHTSVQEEEEIVAHLL